MRLYHVSEEANIGIFNPRIPDREDLDKSKALVWAIDDKRLPNFLTPRKCPRVTYHIGKDTTKQDIERYFTSDNIRHVLIIEHKWFEAMKNTVLYLYEFDESDFSLQDEIAGYYIATKPQKPKAKFIIDDLFNELFKRNIELRIVDDLWRISEEIKKTTLNWSICRMIYAQPKK